MSAASVPSIEERLYEIRKTAALIELLTNAIGYATAADSDLHIDRNTEPLAWFAVRELAADMTRHLAAVELAVPAKAEHKGGGVR
jgi:hypothetical protein